MSDNALKIIIEKISDAHCGDEKQLEVIFSNHKRLIVEAPAGYGKTKTMISKIAYILASGSLPKPKKILALTFSVNAAYKIKKDVAELLPDLLYTNEVNPVQISNRVFVSNYHGFCRHVLKLYGYLIDEKLREIDTLKPVNEDTQSLTHLGVGLTYDEALELSNFNDAIKNSNNKYLISHCASYLSQVRSHLLTNDYITHNSIILFTISLFKHHPKLLNFYQQYFPIIIVDEFQDTNLLSYHLLNCLISDKTKVIFIGDRLQRIYGFIGAIRNLMGICKKNLNMELIKLNQNYRFRNNPFMLLLDNNLRKVAENPLQPDVKEKAEINLNLYEELEDEAQWVAGKASSITQDDNDVTVAILVRSRGGNTQEIIDYLDRKQLDYFYGLFRDDDTDYIQFHEYCNNFFIDLLKKQDRITKLFTQKLYNQIKKQYSQKESSLTLSLLELLKIFLDRLINNYRHLENDEKIRFCLDTFDNKALRQQMEYINKKIILTTIHGAKGLEWEYVILPDMEQNVFPMYPSLCKYCLNKYNSTNNGRCILNYNKDIDREFIEELSVFYVAVTRAKKQVFFSASKERIN